MPLLLHHLQPLLRLLVLVHRYQEAMGLLLLLLLRVVVKRLQWRRRRRLRHKWRGRRLLRRQRPPFHALWGRDVLLADAEPPVRRSHRHPRGGVGHCCTAHVGHDEGGKAAPLAGVPSALGERACSQPALLHAENAIRQWFPRTIAWEIIRSEAFLKESA